MNDSATCTVPERFDTPRLVLRPFDLDDAAELHEAFVESRAALVEHLWFLSWVAEKPSLDAAVRRCRSAHMAFRLGQDFAYLAFERSTSRLVASVDLHRTNWALPATEVGYWVRTGAAGRGFVTEGVQALVGWALGTLHAVRVELVTDERNGASRAVAERCGFTLEGIHHHVMRDPLGELRSRCVYAQLGASPARVANET
jgi:RimJ/RimL family protein N-acetyltransferase